jgi:uncharacterized membrane protein
MNFGALTFASPAVIIHLIFALTAFVIGGFQLVTQKGTRTHRMLGYTWVVAMVVVWRIFADSSFELVCVGSISQRHLFC